MKIDKKVNGNELTIKLDGRLDTTTVTDLEKEIENINNAKSIVFDFENLEYISSAGLRIILKVKKQNDTTKVINCSSEVYDIFNMTGFSEIMEVSKALRKISVDGCEIIGKGFYGTVYRIDPETIVKVYKEGYSIESIEREISLARRAFVLGVPTAIPYDIVRIGNLYGSVFELINSKSIQEMIIEGANIEELVKELVNVLKKIHSTEVENGELTSTNNTFIDRANKCKDYLPTDIGEKLIHLINDIPTVNTMIHGDYHIKNIMKQNGEILLIDMDTISVGHPIFELSGMYATYRAFACVNKNNTQEFLGISLEQSEKILELTFKYYFQDKPQEYIDDVMQKASILAYMEVLWLRTTFLEENNEVQKQEIQFCINYLIQKLPEIDSLVF